MKRILGPCIGGLALLAFLVVCQPRPTDPLVRFRKDFAPKVGRGEVGDPRHIEQLFNFKGTVSDWTKERAKLLTAPEFKGWNCVRDSSRVLKVDKAEIHQGYLALRSPTGNSSVSLTLNGWDGGLVLFYSRPLTIKEQIAFWIND